MKRIFLFIFLIFEFFLSSFLTYKFLSLFEKEDTGASSREFRREEVSSQKREELDTENLAYNILLLGYGGVGHEGGNLSDVIMIVNVNLKDKKITAFSIPRDLWVEIPIRSDVRQSFKINAAFAIGSDDTKYPLKEPKYKGEEGGKNMAKVVVSEVTGMPIHYFVAVDFENFKRIVDTLGGIEVDVPVAFDDFFYPIKGRENDTCGKTSKEIVELHAKYSGFELEKQFTCRYEHLHFDKGKQVLNGENVLKFVRSRHSSQHGGDFARSQRQKAVLLALRDRLLSLTAVKNLGELFEEFSGFVKTDISKEFVLNFTKVIDEVNKFEFKFVSLNEDNVLVSTRSLDGQFILIPKEGEGVWVQVHKFIQEQIKS